MAGQASRDLRRLARLSARFTPPSSSLKRRLLAALARRTLPRSSEVHRLHEILCFLKAYPDDPAILAEVERMLTDFPRRPDLRKHREALADSGIAGTAIRFRFFAPTADWLARRWPALLQVDWERLRNHHRLEAFLPLLVHYAETPGLDEWDLGLRGWLRRLKGKGETEGTFLARRFAALPAGSFVRERVFDDLDIPMRLEPGPGSPSRSRARLQGSPVVFVRGEISRRRPQLPADLLQSPRAIRALPKRQAERVIDLAREAMVTRQRDLDLFSYASPADVRLAEWEAGLQFACIGATPERRLLLEAVYAFLTLKNGVPVGYVLVSALFGSSEIAYNVFETYRGVEAGPIYGKALATARHLFGSDAFTIFPYQLGRDNEEAIRSGAWWFYQKVGFRPKSPIALRIMRRELARMKRHAAHRSTPATLRVLAEHNLHYFLGRARRDVIGADFLPNLGLRVTDALAERFGADREVAARTCAAEAAGRLGVRSLAGFTPGERQAWERWAPLVCLLPGMGSWSPGQKRALVRVVRAKGGRRESDFVVLFDAHRRLRSSLLRLAESKSRVRWPRLKG